MYVRRVSEGYDPTTGTVSNTETTYTKAGAITKRMREENQDGGALRPGGLDGAGY